MAYQRHWGKSCSENYGYGCGSSPNSFSAPLEYRSPRSCSIAEPNYSTSRTTTYSHSSRASNAPNAKSHYAKPEYASKSRRPYNPSCAEYRTSSGYSGSDSEHISRPPPSRSDYIAPSQSHTCFTRTNSSRPSHSRTTNLRDQDYTSRYDKSDYQMIKDGGWGSKKEFMEGHGLRLWNPEDFKEAKNLLNEYERVDAQAAGGSEYSSEQGSHYARGRSGGGSSGGSENDEYEDGGIEGYNEEDHDDDDSSGDEERIPSSSHGVSDRGYENASSTGSSTLSPDDDRVSLSACPEDCSSNEEVTSGYAYIYSSENDNTDAIDCEPNDHGSNGDDDNDDDSSDECYGGSDLDDDGDGFGDDDYADDGYADDGYGEYDDDFDDD